MTGREVISTGHNRGDPVATTGKKEFLQDPEEKLEMAEMITVPLRVYL